MATSQLHFCLRHLSGNNTLHNLMDCYTLFEHAYILLALQARPNQPQHAILHTQNAKSNLCCIHMPHVHHTTHTQSHHSNIHTTSIHFTHTSHTLHTHLTYTTYTHTPLVLPHVHMYIVLMIYYIHVDNSSSQLCVVSLYLTHLDSICQQSSHEYH